MKLWCNLMYKKHVKKILLVLSVTVFLVLLSKPDDTLLIAHSRQLLSFSLQQHFQDAEQICIPKKHILFLKTHKCGSSTIQNIFLRYGYKNNLTFALAEKANYLGSPSHFKASMIPPSLLPSNGLVDIFCVHSRLKQKEMEKVLYKDAFWVTVLREPAALFESLYNYYHLDHLYKRNLERFSKVPLEKLQNIVRTTGKFGKNQMLFDLGEDENVTISDLQETIKELDKTFDLVMIAEKMDESLILLRNDLCWENEDIIYFTKNARQTRFKTNITTATERTLRKLNSADKILYEYFLAKHELKVASYGDRRMQEEVEALRALRQEAYDQCIDREVNGKDPSLKFKEYSDQVAGYALANNSGSQCLLLTYPELPFIGLVRERQRELIGNDTLIAAKRKFSC